MKKLRSHKFTMMDFLVIIVIVFILAAMIIPMSCGRAPDKARQGKCLNNLKQMGTAIHMYYADYEQESLPAQTGILDKNHQWTKQFEIETPYLKCQAKHKVATQNRYRISSSVSGQKYSHTFNVDSTTIADESIHEIGGKLHILHGDGSVSTENTKKFNP